MKVCLLPCPIASDPMSGMTSQGQSLLYLPYLPVGLLTIGALLEQAGHEVDILDPVLESKSGSTLKSGPDRPEHLARLIRSRKPDLVGFGTICSSYPLTIGWAEAFHELSPKVPVLLGGPHATATDEQTLRAFPWIDFVLRGEVENSIIPLVTCLDTSGDLDAVPGLTWRRDGRVVRNPDAAIVSDLDSLPTPAYHLYPVGQLFQRYDAKIGPFHQPFPLEAGRGCPYSCSFCSTSGFFRRRYRAKSPERLIVEMVALHSDYGLDHFDLSHDLFTCDRAYVSEFCRRLREENLHKLLKWECYSRIDTVDRRTLTEMAAAGCVRVFYGIETGSQRMQKIIGKNLPLREVRPIVKETLSLGMNATTSFIFGFPQELPEDLSATLSLAVEMVGLGVDQVPLLPLIPLVGSGLYREFGHTIRCEEQQSRDRTDAFSGLCHYETPYLDGDMLAALGAVFNRYPRLLAALPANNVDLSSVFNAWPTWRRIHMPAADGSYYRGPGFASGFLQFLREQLRGVTATSPVLDEMVHYLIVMERVAGGPESAPIVSQRFSCDVVAAIRCLADNKALSEDELRPATYLFWKNGGRVITQRLTPALAELLAIREE